MNGYYYEQNRSKLGATEILIIINCILFLPWFFRGFPLFRELFRFTRYYLSLNIGFSDVPCFDRLALWQPVTAMFMHGNVSHLFFNMYALYIFGKPLEVRWGTARFASFYMTVGILANIAGGLIFILTGRPLSLIGASGAVYGVLLGYGSLYPDSRLLLFFIIPIKVKWCVLLYAAIELLSEIGSVSDGVAHSVHLFGFLFAFLYILIFMHRNAIHDMFFKDDVEIL
ncbi:MAG: rhomboid family intramembrane serine protease [Spirochaetales bacterium]|jgi:membrane associated rhomboid family serine protease|nr:rhomboid family intramembrane serine protease [Spirochaetales bacterium]MBR6060903.1 rhomboid family intramembrane serine protease [Spirochaetales bacterium]MBR6198891.1 rhomboid family intramembrane serine protease [Spirochaetales bacterium]